MVLLVPERLKNLIFGRIESITIIDGSKIEMGDLGNNFVYFSPFIYFCILLFGFLFLTQFLLLVVVDKVCVGQSKAKSVCAFLQELNDVIKAKFIEEYSEALIEANPSFISQFTLAVATPI